MDSYKQVEHLDHQQLDILKEIYMPVDAGRPRAQKGQRSLHSDGDGNSRKRKKKDARQAPSFRKAYRGDIITEKKEENDKSKLDDKLLEEISECLQPCSRQRLRAVHMSMRQYGDEASRISSKDVIASLQENKVTIHDRLLKPLFMKFEDIKGIVHLECLYKFLVEAHSKTGRDSVLAMRKRNDIAPAYDVPQEEIDEDLIWRIQALLIKSRSYIDISELREAFRAKDSQKGGKVEISVARQICNEHQMPVYGALLKNLMKRCDAEKNDKLNWTEFISFLERGQRNAWISCPELKELPEKMKRQTPVVPTILDELSTRTKNTLVTKLRKKASIKRQDMAETSQKEASAQAANNKENESAEKKETKQTPREAKMSDVNSVREEPHIVGIKTDNLLKGEYQDTVTTAITGTPVIIDIIPPSKEPTIESDEYFTNTDSSYPAQNKTGAPGAIEEFKPDYQTMTDSKIAATDKKKDVDGGKELSTAQSSEDGKCSEEVSYQEKQQHKDSKASVNDIKPNEETEMQARCEGAVTLEVHGQEVTFKVPDDFISNQTLDPPEQQLRMQWVYGYRGNDCRKNIHVVAGGDIVYFMSYIAVLYNKDNHTQRHYTEHTDDIKCIDVHSDGLLVATGQFGSRKNINIQAHIRIWRSDTLQTVKVIGVGELERAVACLAFSPIEEILAVVDNSKKLSVWNFTTGEKKGEELLQTELVCDVGFCPKIPNTIITIGKEHIGWWTVFSENNKIKSAAKAEYEGFPPAKFVICLSFNDHGDLITGDSNGSIYIWRAGGNRITNHIKHAHDGPVFSVLCRDGYLYSGGRDGILHCWRLNENMESAGFLQLPHDDGGIRMLQVCHKTLILGTTLNSLHLVKLKESSQNSPLTGVLIDATPITQCHYDDLRGIAIASKSIGYNVLTAGIDGIICMFDTNGCKAVSKTQIKGNQFLCIDADDTGMLVAFGTKDGRVLILNHKEDGKWQELFEQKICKDRVSVIRISPEKKFIAAGSQDAIIYMFAPRPKNDGAVDWEFSGKLEGHRGAIKGLDWIKRKSNGDLLLRSSSALLEEIFWDPMAQAILSEKVPADVEFVTHTCWAEVSLLGMLTSKYSQELDLESVDVSTVLNITAVGENKSCLSLYRYPCGKPGASCHSYKSHAIVRNVRFTQDGRCLLTVGGRDSCLIQWEVV